MPRSRPEPLTLPEGVRFPRDEEFPLGYEADRDRIARANLTTGYVIRGSREESAACFEVNVHAPQVFAFVRDVALAILPAVAAPIVGFKDEQPVLGPYTSRDAALAVFEPHRHALQHDGFLEFGLIFQTLGCTEEVFVRAPKYVQIWTNYPSAVLPVFEQHGLPEVPDLQFIDEYPMVTASLVRADGNATWPDVIEQLTRAFAQLPRR